MSPNDLAEYVLAAGGAVLILYVFALIFHQIIGVPDTNINLNVNFEVTTDLIEVNHRITKDDDVDE